MGDIRDCPKCGGTHYGSRVCPQTDPATYTMPAEAMTEDVHLGILDDMEHEIKYTRNPVQQQNRPEHPSDALLIIDSLQRELTTRIRACDGLNAEVAALRAEVERLKAQAETHHAVWGDDLRKLDREHARANAAEAALARHAAVVEAAKWAMEDPVAGRRADDLRQALKRLEQS